MNDLDCLLEIKEKLVTISIKVKFKDALINDPANSQNSINLERITAEKLDLIV